MIQWLGRVLGFSQVPSKAAKLPDSDHREDLADPSEIYDIRQLMKRHVPEIASGDVRIRSIARAKGYRTKIAVDSVKPNVDPVRACVGKYSDEIVQRIVE